jgi:hypothetical protein
VERMRGLSVASKCNNVLKLVVAVVSDHAAAFQIGPALTQCGDNI